MKLPTFEQWTTSLAVALLAALGVRLALGDAGWVELGALVVITAFLTGSRVLADRRRAQEDLEAAAQRAAEARAESRITAALGELEQLKARVSRLASVVQLGAVLLFAMAGFS